MFQYRNKVTGAVVSAPCRIFCADLVELPEEAEKPAEAGKTAQKKKTRKKAGEANA